MSINDKNQRLRDPFFTSSLPRTYYHPSPTRDVDIHVAIQSPDKKDHSPTRSKVENPFETGSTLKLSALPQLKTIITKTSDRIADIDDVYSSEQPSNSTLLDTSHLTSSIEERERTASIGYIPHQTEEDSRKEGSSISVIQKYIDRFRYSAPKSREERAKEKAQKQKTFWWLNSDEPQCQDVAKPAGLGFPARPSPKEQMQRSSKLENGVKLTREAVLELDRETSYLQQKADKLLSKSQLSLASSGPCVSTDGLGSSTALSECSYKSDQQTPYRPIFVNLQGHSGDYQRDYVKPKEKFQTIEEEHSLSPKDVLARWRRRRMMGDSNQRNVRVPTTQKPHSEIDVRLQEFRKKLFSQRTLITTEDIEFERQKMKMIIDDDEDQQDMTKANVIGLPTSKEEPQPSIKMKGEDPILSRLKQITKANELPNGNSAQTSHMSDSSIPHKFSIDQTGHSTANSQGVASFNSNNANFTQDVSDFNINPFSGDPSALNRNNTALSHSGIDIQGDERYIIDDMTSMQICDAKQTSFSLSGGRVLSSNSFEIVNNKNSKGQSKNSNSEKKKKSNERTVVDRENPDHSNDGEMSDTSSKRSDLSSSRINKSSRNDKKPGSARISHNRVLKQTVDDDNCIISFDNSDIENSPCVAALDQNTQYHQRLEAEKPCGESDQLRKPHNSHGSRSGRSNSTVNKSDGYESENSVSSKRSDKSGKSLKVENKRRQRSREDRNLEYFNEENLSETSPKKSDIFSANVINTSGRSENSQENARNVVNLPLVSEESKLKQPDEEKKDGATTQPSTSQRKEARAPQHVEKIGVTVSRSSNQNNIHKAIGEAVVDHLFDGPSMISSVDSWASLFPQSPSQSHQLYNSTIVTPTKESYNNQIRSPTLSPSPSHRLPQTPPNQQIITSTPHSDRIATSPYKGSEYENVGNQDSCDEFESDPLMTLLLQQKKEYIQKLELIEMKLQQFEDESS